MVCHLYSLYDVRYKIRNCSGEHIFNKNRCESLLSDSYFLLNMYSPLSVTEKSEAFGGALLNSYQNYYKKEQAIMKSKISSYAFSTIYPLYLQKVEKKGRIKEELDQVICWLTGYDEQGLRKQIDKGIDLLM